jgi:hypothetical protein
LKAAEMAKAAARLKPSWSISEFEVGVLVANEVRIGNERVPFRDGIAVVVFGESDDEYLGRYLRNPRLHNLGFRKTKTRNLADYEVQLLARKRPRLQKTV